MSRIPFITRTLLLTLLLCMGLGSSASAACHEEGKSRSQAVCPCCSPKSSPCCKPNAPTLQTTDTAHTLTPCSCAFKPYTENTTHALPRIAFDFDLLLLHFTQASPVFKVTVPLQFCLETHGIFGNHSPPLPSRAPPHA